MADDSAARDVGELAFWLAMNYAAHETINRLLRHPIGLAAVDAFDAEHESDPSASATIERRDGTVITHHSLRSVLRETSSSQSYVETLRRAWLGGALITLGDAIKRGGGFGKGPDLELVRHLRNGIAHGNRVTFEHDEPRRPAFFIGSDRRIRPDGSLTAPGERTTFAVDASMDGEPVLFDFMGPGDVLDLLHSIWRRLALESKGDTAPPDL